MYFYVFIFRVWAYILSSLILMCVMQWARRTDVTKFERKIHISPCIRPCRAIIYVNVARIFVAKYRFARGTKYFLVSFHFYHLMKIPIIRFFVCFTSENKNGKWKWVTPPVTSAEVVAMLKEQVTGLSSNEIQTTQNISIWFGTWIWIAWFGSLLMHICRWVENSMYAFE